MSTRANDGTLVPLCAPSTNVIDATKLFEMRRREQAVPLIGRLLLAYCSYHYFIEEEMFDEKRPD